MEKETLIRPSLLGSDLLHLSADVEEAISLGIASLHFDVMDGNFVEQISFGQPLFKALTKAYSDKISFDVHLMTTQTLKQLRSFINLGAKEVYIHIETLTSDLSEIEKIKEEYPHVRLGITLNPETDVETLYPISDLFDAVLVMSVHPGKGGQEYIPSSTEKVEKLSKYRKRYNKHFTIAIDGGINDITGPIALKAGVDHLIAGSYYFRSADKREAIKRLKGE